MNHFALRVPTVLDKPAREDANLSRVERQLVKQHEKLVREENAQRPST